MADFRTMESFDMLCRIAPLAVLLFAQSALAVPAREFFPDGCVAR
jgi:hypothetical protein